MKQTTRGHYKKSELRAAFDAYPTPHCATKILLDNEKFVGNIWECASGVGHICKSLRLYGYNDIIASDIQTGEEIVGERGVDFMKDYRKVNNIITNPPYKQAQEFIEHGLPLVTHKLAVLCRIDFIESAARFALFERHSLRIKRILVISNRLPFYSRQGRWDKIGATFGHAWFVWDYEYSGNTKIDWFLHDGSI